MFYVCPKDPAHQSVDSDYCSICGAKIAGATTGPSSLKASVAAPTGTSPVQGPPDASCPDCGAPRRPGARFCEVCRYNFDTQKSGSAPPPIVQGQAVSNSPAAPENTAKNTGGSPPQSAQDPQVSSNAAGGSPAASITENAAAISPLPENAPPSPALGAPQTGSATAVQWEALIRVDPSLYVEPDPAVPCPTNEPERVFPIDLSDNLIGRRSPRKDIFPQIPLDDPGISHRHAKILRSADGTLLLLDVGSTNGTELNGKEVQAGVRTPLQNGDQITLGCWTRIVVQSHQVNQ